MKNQNAQPGPDTENAATALPSPAVIPARFPIWKRCFDLALVLLTVPVWLPMMLLLGILVYCADPGPILFRQQRVGHLGRAFTCLKFRTMKTDAEHGAHEALLDRLISTAAPMTKLDAIGDPRLIRFARILRAGGLDELPQLFNVIRGEMSLVGPRPCTPFEYERYTPSQRARFNVPPGLTGYWQVNGKNKTTFARMIELDLYYASHLSLGMDLYILWRTVPAVVTQIRDVRSRAAVKPAIGNSTLK